MTNIAPVLWFYDELHHRFWPRPGHGRLCRFGTPPPPSLSFSCLENASFAVCSFGLWLWHRHGSPLSIHMTQRGQQHRKGVRTPPRHTHLRNAVQNEQKRNIHHSRVRIKVLTSLWVWPGWHSMCVSVSPYVWMTGISNDEDISRQPVCRLHRVRLRRRQITCRLAPILYLGTYCDIKFNISVLFWDEMTHPSRCGVALSQNVFRTLLLL